MSELDIRARFTAAAIALATAGRGNFTLSDLSTESGLPLSEFRRLFGTRAALIDAAKDLDPAAMQACPSRAVRPASTGDEQWVERRFRILERAISSLESQLADLRSQCESSSAKEEGAFAQTLAPDNIAPQGFYADQLPPIDVQHSDLPLEPGDKSSEAAFMPPELALKEARASANAAYPSPKPGIPDSYWSVASKLVSVAERMRPRQVLLVLLLAILCGVLAGILMPKMKIASGRPKIAVVAANSRGARRTASHPITLLERASGGDVAAQRQLAVDYMKGTGVQADFGSAVHWATAAASSGDPDAQFLLGSLYETGMSPDLKVAVHWYAQSAEQGNVKAMHNLGIDLLDGSGVPKDSVTAAHWFERAASLGYKDSQFDLGVLYERGEGVGQDPSLALQWYQRAARDGDVEAALRASWLEENVPGLVASK